ncbi:MAG: exonuclease SbcCD subunit D C-terminal domain-containing protein [Bowdeniella nasicola]|nr:exonuclease SbcCD subunit D C-terminal domain-containing protein [Bowdeniella nasicola]
MRIWHTSDWHLGRTFHQLDLRASHAAYLTHLVEAVQREAIDVVLLAGDCFDRVYPPLSAVSQLHEVLRELTRHTTVVITSGNHDSPTRLGMLAGLTCERLHLITTIEAGTTPLVLTGRDGHQIALCALPYLGVDASRRELAAADGSLPERSHQAVMDAAVARICANLEPLRATYGSIPVVIAAHAFVAGARASQSERDIRIGGLDRIAANTFDPANPSYVALGHLHRPQDITGGSCPIRYSGSPLALSFSEATDVKSSTIASITADSLTLRQIPAPVTHPLREIRGQLEELLTLEIDADTWVKAVVRDNVRPPRAWAQLRERIPGLVVLSWEPEEPQATDFSLPQATRNQPLAVAEAFFAHVRPQATLSESEAALVRAAYETVREQ